MDVRNRFNRSTRTVRRVKHALLAGLAVVGVLVLFVQSGGISNAAASSNGGVAANWGDVNPVQSTNPPGEFVANPARRPLGNGAPASPRGTIKQVMFENFDKLFPPSQWKMTGNGWWKSNCKVYSGKYSVWAIQKTGALCGDNYGNDEKFWLVYGPFGLQKAKAADLYFKLWLNAEQGKDSLFVGVSLNGNNYYGVSYSGVTPGLNTANKTRWNMDTNTFTDGAPMETNLTPDGTTVDWASAHVKLTKMHDLGKLVGKQTIWLAFVWRTDGQNTLPYGAFVDDVLITKTLKPK